MRGPKIDAPSFPSPARCFTFCALATVLAATTLPGHADDCRFEDVRQTKVDAASARSLDIVARAGNLRIEGKAGLGEVRVEGRACASSQELLDDIRLESGQRGNRIRIVAEMPEGRLHNAYARLDLTLQVPESLAVEIDDGSGDIDIRNVAAVEIDDGSGEITAREIAGDLRIDDGSGEIEIDGVRGAVRIDDGSGDIGVASAGSVTVDDGSGDIDIAAVDGDVLIVDDGSGDISVRDVAGDFTVEDDGSGGIRHRNVGGRVSVPEDD